MNNNFVSVEENEMATINPFHRQVKPGFPKTMM